MKIFSDAPQLNPATGLAQGAQTLPFTLGPLNRPQQLQPQVSGGKGFLNSGYFLSAEAMGSNSLFQGSYKL